MRRHHPAIARVMPARAAAVGVCASLVFLFLPGAPGGLPDAAMAAARKSPPAAAAFVPTVEESPLGGALTLMRIRDEAPGYVNAILSSGSDGLLLVDHAGNWQTMTCDSVAARVFEKAIRAHAEGQLRYLINTHWHGDHVGGNERYGREAVIIAHRST